MRKESGPLIIQRPIFCIYYLMDMKIFLSVLRNLTPTPVSLGLLSGHSFIMRLYFRAETMADAFF